jgi:predicted amidohydrolase YtcJ
LGPLMREFAAPKRMVEGLSLLKTYMHRAGVTALNEPGAQIGPDQLKLYQAVLGAEDTPFTTTLIVDGRTMYERHGERALEATEQTIASAPTGKVRYLAKQIKFFADGAIVSQKMQMKDGYTDGHRGEWMTEPENFKAAWTMFWNAGYQPHTHVNGDLGLDMVLDAMELGLQLRPREDHRSVIVHFANSTEDQVKRIARLGAVVSANPYYVPAFADAYGQWGLGPERADQMTRLGSCVREGVTVSLHSDMPIGPARPLFNAWCAVNRTTVSGRVAGPEQRLSVEQALRAITIDAAQSWRLDHEMGSIAPGKVANLAVLEDDPLSVDPSRLKDVGIWGTMFEGRVVPV